MSCKLALTNYNSYNLWYTDERERVRGRERENFVQHVIQRLTCLAALLVAVRSTVTLHEHSVVHLSRVDLHLTPYTGIVQSVELTST